MKEVIISEQESGQRFDKFLGKYLTGAGRSFLYKMLRKKNITLNGKKATGSEILSSGDSIKIFFSDETFEKFSKQNTEHTTLPPYSLDIIFEDQDILIINKPAGILSQKAKSDDVSLNDYVVDYVSRRVSDIELRAFTPSIANRLDRNTSGIVVAGKTLKGLQNLSKALKERTAEKYYLAIVKGIIKDTINFDGYLKKDKETNKVDLFDIETEGAAHIITEVIPVKSYAEYSLVKIKLVTGKTHQIRATLSHLGFPIVGDRKYGDRLEHIAKRQMLHSYELIIDNKTFKANIPDDFSIILERLNLN